MPLATLEGIVAGAVQDPEERRKRLYLALCIAIGGPAVSIYAVFDVVAGRMVEGLVVLVTTALLMAGLPCLRCLRGLALAFRVFFAVVLGLMGYMLAIGAGDGLAFLWFYFLPLTIFYVAGTREGLLWVGLSVVLAAGVMLGGVGPHAYDPETALRFLVTYALVAVLARGLELSRRRWYRALKDEKQALALALAQVKTLRGLLPICASCKRVRDDQGYWRMLDEYLEKHSEVGLSHGICPDCVRTLYPEFSTADDGRDKPGE